MSSGRPARVALEAPVELVVEVGIVLVETLSREAPDDGAGACCLLRVIGALLVEPRCVAFEPGLRRSLRDEAPGIAADILVHCSRTEWYHL